MTDQDTKKVFRARLSELQAEYAALRKKSAKQRARLEEISRQREALRIEKETVKAEIREIEGDRGIALPKEISFAAKLAGGKQMSDGVVLDKPEDAAKDDAE